MLAVSVSVNISCYNPVMIMVTGASGFIGRSLMRILESQEREVRAYSGRMNDPLRLREELEGVTTVIHLAGSERRGRARLLQHVDVEGTERLLEECGRAGVQRLLFVSRLGADPNSIYPLLRAKGVLCLSDQPDRRTIYQRVGARWRYSEGGPWGDDEPRSTLVLIGPTGWMERSALAARLDACRQAEAAR